MTGIQFVTDEKGQKTAVQIDLKEHGDIWDDFYDTMIAEERLGGKTESYEAYRSRRT